MMSLSGGLQVLVRGVEHLWKRVDKSRHICIYLLPTASHVTVGVRAMDKVRKESSVKLPRTVL